MSASGPVERYAGATAVVTGQQKAGAESDVLFGERARVSSALAARLAAVPGVRAAIGDVSACRAGPPAAAGSAERVLVSGDGGVLVLVDGARAGWQGGIGAD